jgi:TonB family protein
MASSTALSSSYGAFEIKRAYRKNMTTGISIACLFVLLLTGAAIFINVPDKTVIKPIENYSDGKVNIGPPPTFVLPRRGTNTSQPKPPSIGRLVAVPDSLVDDQNNVPTNSEIEQYISSLGVKDLGDINANDVEIPLPDDNFPSDTDFVYYEEPPIIIESISPKYPEIARRAGIEGVVWVSVLLDKSGNVRDVRISKDSGANAGFEEAAIDAARRTVWKPAISNGQPVALWVSYKIVFTLKGSRE